MHYEGKGPRVSRVEASALLIQKHYIVKINQPFPPPQLLKMVAIFALEAFWQLYLLFFHLYVAGNHHEGARRLDHM